MDIRGGNRVSQISCILDSMCNKNFDGEFGSSFKSDVTDVFSAVDIDDFHLNFDLSNIDNIDSDFDMFY